MLCQARKSDGSYCNNLANSGQKTCHIQKHREQFMKKKVVQSGGWGQPIEDLPQEKEFFTQGGGWGDAKVSWLGGLFKW